MKRIFWIGFFLFYSWFTGCGSPAVSINVQIASNQLENPMLRIEADLKAIPPKSLGIFFHFDALKCNATTINDIDGTPQIIYPKNLEEGNSPTQDSYPIPNSILDPKKYYSVTMVALNTGQGVTHKGVTDCPINLSVPGANKATICFGIVGGGVPPPPPLCAGLTPFNKCPGISQGICPN